MTPQVNGRGMAKASASTNEPFQMRIPSPSAELTGEVLAKKVPEDPNRIGSVYADEYLADLVPPEFDDLQRRQFFCILDLRRLKYAADEVFVKKDWKLNIMNFAKEYEKSRSLIMLRYGLYEFKTVRPSAEVMRSWRASHGLPEPDEEQPQTNGTKAPIFTQSSKRKAEEELTKDTALATSSPNKTKRRAVDQEPVEDRPIHPLPSKKKRSLEDEEQNENTPTKVQRKAAPSATRSVFEAVADNAQGITSAPTVSVTPAKPATDSRPTAKPAAKATVGARSVLEGFKPGTNGQNLATSNNIFGYLSDAGSANGSINADADGESESESEEEEAGQAGAAQSYEPSVAASGGADTPSSTIGQSLFPPPTSGLATGPSSTSSEARETTPSRSLFDRVTKGADGQPVRAVSADATRKSQAISESVAEKPSLFGNGKPKVPSDQTYKPDTPLKFAPAAGTSLFGTAQAKPPVSNPFAPKDTSGAPSLFGGPKAETTKEPSATSQPQPSTGGEDKSQASALDGPPTKRPAFGAASKPSTTAPTTAAPTPASTLFGSAPKAETAPSTTAPPSLFGTTTKPAESAPSTFKPSTSTPSLFADLNKPAPETPKPAAETTPNVSTSTAPSLFGTTAKTDAGTSNIFAKSGTSTPSIFGAGEQKPASSLFGGDLKPATSEAKPAPSLFGGATTGAVTESKPAFPPSTPGPAAPPIFGGSPMKVEPSKPAGGSIFGGTAPAAAPAPIFNFGGAKTSAPSTTGSIFGASSAVPSQPTPPAPIQFGSGSSASFTFSAGSVPNNPFASAGSSQPSGSASAPSSFTFGAGGGGSSSTPGTFSFTAGGSGSSAPAPSASGAPFVFGAGSSQPQAPTTSAGSSGIFGGQATSAPSISFTGAAPPANNIFGNKPAAATPSIFGGLAPNLGGASTGTSNSPLFRF